MKTSWKPVLGLLLILLCSSFPALAEVVCSDDTAVGQKLSLPIYEWQDPNVRPKGLIVAVQGLTFYGAAFDDLARYFAKEGYRFYAFDMRGFGRWKVEPDKFHGDSKVHFSQSQDDLIKLLKQLRQDNPKEKIFCLGESLGANFAIWVASDNPQLVNGIIAGSPCVKRYLHPRLRWPADFLQGLLHPKTEMNLEPYINPYLSHDKALTLACLRDPKICRRLSPEDLIKTSVTNRRTLANVKDIPRDLPILLVAGDKDRVFKVRALKKFVPEIGSKQVSVRILKNKGHLLLEHQSVQPEIAELLDQWLDAQSQPKSEIVKAQ